MNFLKKWWRAFLHCWKNPYYYIWLLFGGPAASNILAGQEEKLYFSLFSLAVIVLLPSLYIAIIPAKYHRG